MPHTPLAALAFTVIVLAICGCGGASKAGTNNTPTNAVPTTTALASTVQANAKPVTTATVKVASGRPLPRVQWIARGDSICTHLRAQLALLVVRSRQDYARVLPQIAAYGRVALVQLAKLVPPTSKTSDWEQILSATRQWTEDSAKLGESAREYAQSEKPILTTQLGKTIRNSVEHLTGIAKRDGFKECSLL